MSFYKNINSYYFSVCSEAQKNMNEAYKITYFENSHFEMYNYALGHVQVRVQVTRIHNEIPALILKDGDKL